MLVRLNSTLRGRLGRRMIEINLPEGADVRQALETAISEAPVLAPLLLDSHDDLQPNIVVFLDGRNTTLLDGLDTVLAPTNTLDIFPRAGAQRALVRE